MKLPFAVTLGPGSSRADHTGAWRTERAVYVQRTAPCGNACPAGEDVRDWLYDAESGGAGYESAWRRIMETNPFPAVCGRVCYHPCETACNRGNLDEAVGINSVERFLGDEALAQGWRVEVTAAPTGRRVLVVGSGPAGLSAAYHLARRGHAVTIRESAPVAGGMMRYGIPRYRLPREVLDAEITRLLDLGITLEVDTPVTDLDAVMADEGWDAAFLAVGAQLGHRTYLPAASAARVLDAVSLLHGLEDGERPLLGRRVAVYGGGNTAVDAARTARRLGASDAVVVYRRTRERMPAHAEEVADAEEEGVVFHWLSTIERVEPDGLVVEQMELDDGGLPPAHRPDREAGGRQRGPGARPGHRPLLPGRHLRPPGLRRHDRHGHRVRHDAHRRLRRRRRGRGRTLGHDRHRSRSPRGREHRRLAGRTPAGTGPEVDLAPYEALNTWYFEDADRTHRERLELARRSSTFDEVVHGLDSETALYEARRCLSCGSCFSCDNCFAMCPDDAVIKLGPPGEYVIDLDYCKGCGLCVQECPSGAIVMVPEES